MKTPAFFLAASLLLAATVFAAPQPGEKAPDFTLKDTDGKEHHLADLVQAGKTVVLEWFNPDCPFIKRHHETSTTMVDMEKKYREKGVVWLAINSGAPGQQGYGIDRNAKARKDYKMDYPVLIDELGAVGRLYGAKTTPHMFVIGKDGVIAYAGCIDDDPRGQKTTRINYVDTALAETLAGKKVEMAQTDPYGCSVKYGPAPSK